MTDVLWTCRDLRLGSGPRPRLRVETLTLRAGITAVLGPSGAGKSSLLHLLVGFERPDAGSISPEPAAFQGASLPLYWAPQDFGLWPERTVREHVEAVSPKPAAAAAELLAAFGLEEKADVLPGQLSLGERARLAVARALAADARVLVLDEPLSCLGESQARMLWEEVLERHGALGRSLIFATHSPSRVLGVADRVVCLREGEVIYEGPAREAYRRPPSREIAECLGSANWFDAAETAPWLGEGADEAVCVRPEHLEVVEVPDSPVTVRSSRMEGPCTATRLLHSGQGERLVIHRTGLPLSRGMHVVLRVLGCLVAALILAGCGAKPKVVAVRNVRVTAMPSLGASIPAPRGIALTADGRVIAIDTAGRVTVFGRDWTVQRQWSMPEVEVGKPEDLTVLHDGSIAVPDTHYHRVLIVDETGHEVRRFGSYGRGPGQFIYPVSVAEDDRGRLYVCEYGGHDRVQIFSAAGEYEGEFGSFGTGAGQMQRPSGIVWHAGKVYVSDAVNGRILIFSDTGEFLDFLGPESAPLALDFPYDLALGQDDTLWIPEWGAGCLRHVSLAGGDLGRYGRPGSDSGALSTPWGVACRGKRGPVIADTGNRRLVELFF